METLKKLFPVIVAFAVIFLATVFISEALFGDLTGVDSYKPLYIIIPVMLSVLGYLIYKTNTK